MFDDCVHVVMRMKTISLISVSILILIGISRGEKPSQQLLNIDIIGFLGLD
jgi:hypothetical protein